MSRLLHRWPQKLAALLLAVLVWFFVSTDDTTTTQRRLELPLTVEGLGPNQVAVGTPETVEVIVSGPSQRIDSLRPENFSAVLDLTNTTGEFEKEVDIDVLQGINLLQTNPSTIIGTVETRTRKQVPVEVVLLGEPPAGTTVVSSSAPPEVTVAGISSALGRVAVVTAPVRAQAGEATARLYAADAQGQPVMGVTIEPQSARVSLRFEPVLHVRELPVQWQPPQLQDYTIEAVSLSRETLRVAGPQAVLQGLQSVPVTVELDTRQLSEGSYTVEVTPRLEGELVALEPLTATIRLRRLAVNE